MDHGCKALIRFIGPHRDALELFQLAEVILDQVPPFVHLGINVARLGAARML
jgi:hypothetical protein